MPPRRRTTQASATTPLDPTSGTANPAPPAPVTTKPNARRPKKDTKASAAVEESIPAPTDASPTVKVKKRTRSQTALSATLHPTNPPATATKERRTRSQTSTQEPSAGLQEPVATATIKPKGNRKIAERSLVDPKESATAVPDQTLPPKQASRKKRTASGPSSVPEKPATTKRQKAKKSIPGEKDPVVDKSIEQLPAPSTAAANERASDGPHRRANRKTSSTQPNLAVPLPEPEVPKNAGTKPKPKPKMVAGLSNHAERNTSRTPSTSSATLIESTASANPDRSISTSTRSTSTSGISRSSALADKGKGKRKASPPASQELLDEIAVLKAKLAQSEAQRDKEEKLEAAKPVENRPLIPQPRGKYNLQEAMGLKGNKVVYNQCRAAVHSCVVKSDLADSIDWRRQDSAVIVKICSLAKELEPQLRMYERSWAIIDIIRTTFKNRRNYLMKLETSYIAPKANSKKNREGDVERAGGAEDGDSDFESHDDLKKGVEDDEESAIEFGDMDEDESGDDFEREMENSGKTAVEPVDKDMDRDGEFDDSDFETVDQDGGGTGVEAMDEGQPENTSSEDEDEEMSTGGEGKQADSQDEGNGVDEEQVKFGRESLKRPLTLNEGSSNVKRRKRS